MAVADNHTNRTVDQTHLLMWTNRVPMSSIGSRLRTESLTPLHWGAILLTLVTAAVHLLIGIQIMPSTLGISFLLATGSFLGAIVLVLFDVRRRLVYVAGIPFTGVQVVLWYVMNDISALGDIGTLDAVDKIAQLLLIVALVVLLRRES